jgi:hypothetical protein
VAFKSKNTPNVTTETSVITVTAKSVVIGMSVCNVTGNATKATVKSTINGVTSNITKDAPVNPGLSLIPIGVDQKVVLDIGDTLTVTADNAVDVSLSYLDGVQ